MMSIDPNLSNNPRISSYDGQNEISSVSARGLNNTSNVKQNPKAFFTKIIDSIKTAWRSFSSLFSSGKQRVVTISSPMGKGELDAEGKNLTRQIKDKLYGTDGSFNKINELPDGPEKDVVLEKFYATRAGFDNQPKMQYNHGEAIKSQHVENKAFAQPQVSLKDIQGAIAAMKAKNGTSSAAPATDTKINSPEKGNDKNIAAEKQPMQAAEAKDSSASIQETENKEVATPKTMSDLIAEAKLTSVQEALIEPFKQLAENLVNPQSDLGENVGKLQSFIKKFTDAISNLNTKEDILSARKLASELNKTCLQCMDKINIAHIDVSKGLRAVDLNTFSNALQQQPFLSAQRILTNIGTLTETCFGRALDVEEEVDADKQNKAAEKLENSKKELKSYLDHETELINTFSNLQGQINVNKKTVGGVPFFPMVFADLGEVRQLRQGISFQKFKEELGRVDSAEGSLKSFKETIKNLKGILQEVQPEQPGEIEGYIRLLEGAQKNVSSSSMIQKTTYLLMEAVKSTLSDSRAQLEQMGRDFDKMDPARGKKAAEIRENLFNNLDSLLNRIDNQSKIEVTVDKARGTLSQARGLVSSNDQEKIRSTVNDLKGQLAEIQRGVGHGKLQENLTEVINRLENRLEKL